MNSANMANAYKTQQIMTAPPENITLMLYNGAIRFVTESIMAIDQQDIPRARSKNIKAQNIVYEFIKTTDMQYEISETWLTVDRYIIECLVKGYEKQDKAKMEEAKQLLTEFRDTWIQVIKKTRMDKAAGK